METSRPTVAWVILTMGDRGAALGAAIDSLVERSGMAGGLGSGAPDRGERATAAVEVIVVSNGAGPLEVAERPGVRVIELPENVGIPAARNAGAAATAAELVGFLDDDAQLRAPPSVALEAFVADNELGAVALRLVDEHGETARRHIPRAGGRGATTAGPVALFLGGACVMRRSAFEQVGGYWGELWYGHEELELSWRLVDRGWRIRYLPEVTVFHPRTEISRHAAGWEHTGRNRVMIARRTLPWPIALVHASAWLLLGTLRVPSAAARRSYLRGWRRGWRHPVTHRPIGWAAVAELTRLRRPPVI